MRALSRTEDIWDKLRPGGGNKIVDMCTLFGDLFAYPGDMMYNCESFPLKLLRAVKNAIDECNVKYNGCRKFECTSWAIWQSAVMFIFNSWLNLWFISQCFKYLYSNPVQHNTRRHIAFSNTKMFHQAPTIETINIPKEI